MFVRNLKIISVKTMLVRKLSDVGVSNLKRISKTLFITKETQKKFCDFVIESGEPDKLIIWKQKECPLLRSDVNHLIDKLENFDLFENKACFASEDIARMKETLNMTLLVRNSLVENGFLTQTLYRSFSSTKSLENAMQLRVPSQTKPKDVYFSPLFVPHTLWASTNLTEDSKTQRFEGLSCGPIRLRVMPENTILSSFPKEDTFRGDELIEKYSKKNTGKNSRVVFSVSWKLECGTAVPDNLLIDLDGHDHATIAIKEDVPVVYDRANNVVKAEVLTKNLDWKADEEVHAILINGAPKKLVDQKVGPVVAEALERIFFEGDLEDVLMVQRLYLAMEAHHSTCSDAVHSPLKMLQQAFDTIEAFYTSEHFDESDQDLIGTMVTAQDCLQPMIDKARMLELCAVVLQTLEVTIRDASEAVINGSHSIHEKLRRTLLNRGEVLGYGSLHVVRRASESDKASDIDGLQFEHEGQIYTIHVENKAKGFESAVVGTLVEVDGMLQADVGGHAVSFEVQGLKDLGISEHIFGERQSEKVEVCNCCGVNENSLPCAHKTLTKYRLGPSAAWVPLCDEHKHQILREELSE